MARGKIKFWNEDRGFGFIINDDGSGDVFAHIKAFAPGVVPERDLTVAFDMVQDRRSGRMRADNVRAAH